MATTTTTISEKGLLFAEERRFWQDVEVISRTFRDKRVHAYAKKMVKWIGKAMIEIAKDQMDDDEEEMNEETLKRLIEEDKRSDSEKLMEQAYFNAIANSQGGELWE